MYLPFKKLDLYMNTKIYSYPLSIHSCHLWSPQREALLVSCFLPMHFSRPWWLEQGPASSEHYRNILWACVLHKCHKSIELEHSAPVPSFMIVFNFMKMLV